MDVSLLSTDQNHLSLVYNCCFGNQPEWIIMFKQLAASNKKLRVKDNKVSGKVLFPNLYSQIWKHKSNTEMPHLSNLRLPKKVFCFFQLFQT